MSRAITIPTEANIIAVANLVKALVRGGTYQQLADACGFTVITVRKHVNAMHRAGVVYICHWEEDSRGAETIRAFKLGDHPDAKARVETHAQKMRRLRREWKVRKVAPGVTQYSTGAQP